MNISDVPDATIHRASADVLEGARAQARLTHPQLAKLAKMSPVTVQKVLTGDQGIKTSQFMKLAEAAGRDAGELAREAIALALKMSEATGSNVTPLHPRDWTAEQHDTFIGERAAHEFDDEDGRPGE